MRPLLYSENAVKLVTFLVTINIILCHTDKNQSEHNKWQMQFDLGVL